MSCYCKYGISYRELEAMLIERGGEFSIVFSWKNLNHVKKWQIPRVINTDKRGKSSSALSELVAGIENFISIATSLSDGKGID